ncbi:MAG: restriction endonuclease subunit S [Candidatus Thiothrix sulfatifontis]|nr:MAG: restriction endonuclease subunit S [Candidatus Thiothrix sulfatifontis]
MKLHSVPLEDLSVKRGGSVNPEKFPDETFELFSIPAFDTGKAEVCKGKEIGSAKKCVEPNDVLLSRIVPHIRRSWVVGESLGYRQIASGEWIQFRSDNVFPQYLKYFLISDPFHKLFMSTVSGVGGSLLRARPSEVYKIEIPLPPLPEQKRIAAILDAADALRTQRRQSIAELDLLLQSTFLEMFGDPVENPKGWDVVKIEDVTQSRLGKMLDKGKESSDEQYPYLANFNVQWGKIELSELRCMNFNKLDREEFSLCNGDLLICEGGEVGRAAIWRQEGKEIFFQKALHRVRVNKSLTTPEYIQRYFWSMAKNGGFDSFANSATIPHLTGVKLKNLPLPLPPLDKQEKFAEIVESIEAQKERLQAHLTELDTLFASLQQRAFNGEL